MKSKWTIGLISILLCGCFAHSTVMTSEDFSTIQMGESIATVTKQVGEPYEITNATNGTKEYKYIERVAVGNRLLYENHYVLVVKDGYVVGKKTSQEKVPAFDLIYQDDPNHHQYP